MPLANDSLTDCVSELERATTAEEVNALLKAAADGALRMLVVLYFHGLGYQPLEIVLLFLFYEIFGVVTNLLGGWEPGWG
ncbi:hypothetical protein GCM10022394_04760 [Zobellella aerophila]|uniref:Glyceraldehyde 3-phosphate dehydrogenase catalytic domain-containing protein n=1 Tax=Zobellella aerophila TaxID=870480 RepID=A0ABP6V7Q7_9GAMM